MEDAESTQSKLTQSTPRKKNYFLFIFFSFPLFFKKKKINQSHHEKRKIKNQIFKKKRGGKIFWNRLRIKFQVFFGAPNLEFSI